MSEYELISLFNEFFDDSFSRLADFMTGTFAMLVSAFFAGPRLSRNMAGLALFLYTLFAAATAVPTLAASFRFTQAAELLRIAGTEPGSLIPQIFPMLPSPVLVMPVMTLILLGAYVGTVVFFLQSRKVRPPSGR